MSETDMRAERSSFVPAKQGGKHMSVTKKGTGTQRTLVVDGNALPLEPGARQLGGLS
jgi:hypothetical protein